MPAGHEDPCESSVTFSRHGGAGFWKELSAETASSRRVDSTTLAAPADEISALDLILRAVTVAIKAKKMTSVNIQINYLF